MRCISLLCSFWLATALTVSAVHSQLAPHSIACTSPSRVSAFVADFDYSAFHPGSGFFNLVNASIQDNYNSGELTCTGSDFNSTIACVGFNNGMTGAVFYVTIPPSAAYSTYKMLIGAPGPDAGEHWPCSTR